MLTELARGRALGAFSLALLALLPGSRQTH